MDKKYLSPKQAAEYIGLAVPTLAKLRVIGGGPKFAKLARRVIYRAEDLDAWIAARVHASTSAVSAA